MHSRCTLVSGLPVFVFILRLRSCTQGKIMVESLLVANEGCRVLCTLLVGFPDGIWAPHSLSQEVLEEISQV